ncbi:MAG: sulfur oxidation c-type cytochrome SoxA [Rhodospirillales bacterium]|nr:sulfur oxidation c-type cytochrome SoxA [Rhodospirillales bacterium]
MKIKTVTTIAVILGASFTLAACNMKSTSEAPNPYGKEVRSGYSYATPETQAMQDDDFSNPGMPLVDTAAGMWNKPAGEAKKSCADCHGAVDDAKGGPVGIPMKGVSAKYPAYDEATQKPMNLELRIMKCQTENQKAEAFKYDSKPLVGMTGLVAMQSRGMPRVSTADDPNDKLHAAWKAGEEFYYQRRGQLDLACKHCHEDNAGNIIRAELLSQGQSNGFPTYRLKWQGMGSLHKRLGGCNKEIRAEPYKSGSDEYVNLETYLAWRGRGLVMEGPSVRK